MTTRTERKKAKLRFIALYSISLLLIFVVVSAFWQKLAPKNEPGAGLQASEKEAWFLQIDTALHTKMEAMDGLAAGYVKSKKDGVQQPDMGTWLLMRQAFRKTLDSIDQQAGFLTDGPKKTMMTSVAANFRKALDSREAVVNGIMTFPKSPATGTVSNGSLDSLRRLVQERDDAITALQKQAQLAASNSGTAAAGLQATITERDKSLAALQGQNATLQNQLRQKETALQTAASNNKSASNNATIATLQNQVTSLQNQLKQKEAALQASASRPADNSQKDKTISGLQNQVASLQGQLRQKETELRTASASRPVASGGGEWQQKYQSLKVSFDKTAASEKTLRNAYQTLADDNRRLLSQLQAARKG